MTKGKGSLAIHPFIALDENLAGGRGMTDCELVGIAGDCGPACPVLNAGECEHQGEMKTWRDVPWEYEQGRIIARINGEAVTVCYLLTPLDGNTDLLGRAIAHAWNVDLAAARSWRELFGVEDQLKNRESER